MDEIKPLESVKFELFLSGDHQEPKSNILPTTGLTDPLTLLNLFISLQMYITIAENTNLYATAQNATTIRSSTNSRYWYPTSVKFEFSLVFSIILASIESQILGFTGKHQG